LIVGVFLVQDQTDMNLFCTRGSAGDSAGRMCSGLFLL